MIHPASVSHTKAIPKVELSEYTHHDSDMNVTHATDARFIVNNSMIQLTRNHKLFLFLSLAHSFSLSLSLDSHGYIMHTLIPMINVNDLARLHFLLSSRCLVIFTLSFIRISLRARLFLPCTRNCLEKAGIKL